MRKTSEMIHYGMEPEFHNCNFSIISDEDIENLITTTFRYYHYTHDKKKAMKVIMNHLKQSDNELYQLFKNLTVNDVDYILAWMLKMVSNGFPLDMGKQPFGEQIQTRLDRMKHKAKIAERNNPRMDETNHMEPTPQNVPEAPETGSGWTLLINMSVIATYRQSDQTVSIMVPEEGKYLTTNKTPQGFTVNGVDMDKSVKVRIPKKKISDITKALKKSSKDGILNMIQTIEGKKSKVRKSLKTNLDELLAVY